MFLKGIPRIEQALDIVFLSFSKEKDPGECKYREGCSFERPAVCKIYKKENIYIVEWVSSPNEQEKKKLLGLKIYSSGTMS